MAARHLVVWNATSGKIGNIQPGDTGIFAEDMLFAANLTVGGQLNGRDISVDGDKLDLITVTDPIDLDEMQTSLTAAEEVTDLISVTSLVDLDAWKVKLDFISVTQPVDLDALAAATPTNPVTMDGDWDASTNEFPTATRKGQSFICSVPGEVATINFKENDRVIAKVDNPSVGLASSWHIEYAEDVVTSVAGKTGNVTLLEVDIEDLQGYLLPEDLDSLSKLNVLIGDSLDLAGNPRPPTAHTHTESEILDFGNYLASEDINSLLELEAIVGEQFITIGTRRLNPDVNAYAGGGQTDATQLSSGTTLVAVVASPGDSVKLPTAVKSLYAVIINDGAFNMDVYPNTSDKIDTLAIDLPVSVPPNGVLELLALDDERWITR